MDWSTTSYVDPRLIATQKALENLSINRDACIIKSKQRKRQQKNNATALDISSGTVLTSCYLILSIYAHKFIGYCGNTYPHEIKSHQYQT